MPSVEKYNGPYAEKIGLLEKHLGSLNGMHVLEIGCGSGAVAEALRAAGAVVNCLDVKSDHNAPGHTAAPARRIPEIFVEGAFDSIIALALIGSPLAKWCIENNADLRETERHLVGDVHRLLRKGGFLLVYHADIWLKHTSTLTDADYRTAGFSIAEKQGNDAVLLQKV